MLHFNTPCMRFLRFCVLATCCVFDIVSSQSPSLNRIGSHRDLENEIEPCGSDDPSEEDRIADAKAFAAWKSSRQRDSTTSQEPTYVIPVYFHIIASDEETIISDSRVWKYMNYLNESFEDSPFEFALQLITETVNREWSNLGHARHMNFKRALKRGGMETLNVYVTDKVVTSDGKRYTGFTYLPSTNMGTRDGVVIEKASYKDKDRLNTLVHEVGHWLGLLHTFAGDSCDADALGDLVDDTPQHKKPTGFSRGCYFQVDTCRERPGSDPVNNFMTYSSRNHDCRSGFTKGQVERMQYKYETYRKPADDFPTVTITPTISPLVDETCAPLFGGCEMRDCCFFNCRGGFWFFPHFCFL